MRARAIVILIAFTGRLALPCLAGTPAPTPGKAELKILTWNVLAQRETATARLPVLLRLMQETAPDVIALQEVTPWFLEALRATAWARTYSMPMADGQPVVAGGLTILTRLPLLDFHSEVLPGRMGRSVLVIHVTCGERRVALATCHLESYLNDHQIRSRQLDRIFSLLADEPCALLLGDFNFGDAEAEESEHLASGYVDAWRAVHPDDPGFTWDRAANPMALKGSFPGEPSRRLDRILARAPGWRPISCTLLGTRPVAEEQRETFPSDHFGLLAAFHIPATAAAALASQSRALAAGCTLRTLTGTWQNLPREAHILAVDLRQPGIAIRISHDAAGGRSVQEYQAALAERLADTNQRVVASTNGNVAGCIADGRVVSCPDPARLARQPGPHYYFGQDARGLFVRPLDIGPAQVDQAAPDGIAWAFCSWPYYANPVRFADRPYDSQNGHQHRMVQERHPRTLLGLDRAGQTAYFVVIKGRGADCMGMSLEEASAFLQEMLPDLHAAINVDGGYSCALIIGAEDLARMQPDDVPPRKLPQAIHVLAPRDPQVDRP